MGPSAEPSAGPVVRLQVRPLASPLPLGLLAFGIGTLLLSTMELGAIPVGESRTVGAFLLAAVFPPQFTGAVIAVLARDTSSFAALGILAGSWLALGLQLITSTPGAVSHTAGIYALGLAVALVLVAIVAWLGKRFLTILLGLAAARYIAFGLFQLVHEHQLEVVSGILGLVLVVLAAYLALALLLEEARQQTVLPLARSGAARASLDAGLDDQLERLPREPGVRSEL